MEYPWNKDDLMEAAVDTEKCKVLLKVVELGSMAAAGEELGYTTSGVSRMMAALEEKAGFPLLYRLHGGVEATPECERLLQAFRELDYWSDRWEQTASEIRGVQTGDVTVGTSYPAYYPWLARIIAAFRQAYPGVTVRLLQGNSAALYRAMAEHKADFCVVSQREGDFNWIPLAEDPLVAWIPAGHPLAGESRFPIKALDSEPYIDTYPGEDSDNSRCLADQGIRPVSQFTSTDTGATYAMVEAGLGISLENAMNSGNRRGKVAILPLEPPWTVSIGIIYPKADTLTPAAGRFAAFAQRERFRTQEALG